MLNLALARLDPTWQSCAIVTAAAVPMALWVAVAWLLLPPPPAAGATFF
jgi:hypothetical protein